MHFSVKSLIAAAVIGTASVLPATEWRLARVGTNPQAFTFATLNEALAAAQSNDMIDMIGPAEIDTTLPPVIVTVTNLTIELKCQWVTNSTSEGNVNCMLKVGPGGDVLIRNGWITGNGNFIHVQGGRVRVDNIHLSHGQGRPLVVEDGGSADVYNGTELSLWNASPTILVRGDRIDGTQPSGNRSSLTVRDGGLINNALQNGAAIAGDAADAVGTNIRLVGGANMTPDDSNFGIMAKVTGLNGFAVHHPQPGRLEADGEILGATCVAMLRGDLVVSHSNTLFQAFEAPAHPTAFDGSRPTGDAIIAPMGLGHDPTVTIRNGNFGVDPVPNGICIRSVNCNAADPTYPYMQVLTNNICVAGGWFATPVLPEHCVYQPRFGGTWPYTTIPEYDVGGSPVFPYNGFNFTVRRHIYPTPIWGDVNGHEFDCLEAALASAHDNDVINLWSHITITNTIFVAAAVRLRMHGYSIYANRRTMPAQAACAICVLRGGRLDVDGLDSESGTRGSIVSDLPAVIQMNRPGESPVDGERAVLSLNNVDLVGETYGIRGVELAAHPEERRAGIHQTEISVVNSSIAVSAEESVASVGISHRQNGQLLVDNATVSGGDGIDFCGGSLKICNGAQVKGRQGGSVGMRPSSTSDTLASGVGVMVSPRYPVSVSVDGGARIGGVMAIYEKDVLTGYHPAWTPFALELNDCWLDGRSGEGLGVVRCDHGWDFRDYAVKAQSLAKFKDDGLFAGALPIRHALVKQTDESLPTCGWYMLEQLPKTASNEVDVIFQSADARVLAFSRRFKYPDYVSGEPFGQIGEPMSKPAPTGFVLGGWFTSKQLEGAHWQFDGDVVTDSCLANSIHRGDVVNEMYLYGKFSVDSAANAASPNGYLPQTFKSVQEAREAAQGMRVTPPPQVLQSSRIDSDAYQALYVVRTVPVGGNDEAFVNQVVLREEVEMQMKAGVGSAMKNMPLAKLASEMPSSVRVENAVPGMFYSVVSGASLESMSEGSRVLAEGKTLDLPVPAYAGSGFYRLQVGPVP